MAVKEDEDSMPATSRKEGRERGERRVAQNPTRGEGGAGACARDGINIWGEVRPIGRAKSLTSRKKKRVRHAVEETVTKERTSPTLQTERKNMEEERSLCDSRTKGEKKEGMKERD